MQFIDLAAQQSRLRDRIDAVIAEVLDHGAYIMGPHVKAFEREMSDFAGVAHSLGCANGTDALQLALMALEIGAGDAVICPAFTFAATAEIVPMTGAVPVFADSDDETFNICPASCERAIMEARRLGLTPKVVIAVDLFGLPADIPTIEAIAQRECMKVLVDSAQGFASSINGKTTVSMGDVATTSFFPAKPLGCYGDGGAIFTDDAALAARIDSLRVHGKGTDKYDNVRIGMNSRLDTLQAGILSVKLSVYADEIDARNRVASRYSARLSNLVQTPRVPDGFRSVWAQYTVRLPAGVDRDRLQAELKEGGIPTMVYYPMPLHMQTAYRDFPRDPKGLPNAERMAKDVLSLPMHPYLDEPTQNLIISNFNEAIVALASQAA